MRHQLLFAAAGTARPNSLDILYHGNNAPTKATSRATLKTYQRPGRPISLFASWFQSANNTAGTNNNLWVLGHEGGGFMAYGIRLGSFRTNRVEIELGWNQAGAFAETADTGKDDILTGGNIVSALGTWTTSEERLRCWWQGNRVGTDGSSTLYLSDSAHDRPGWLAEGRGNVFMKTIFVAAWAREVSEAEAQEYVRLSLRMGKRL